MHETQQRGVSVQPPKSSAGLAHAAPRRRLGPIPVTLALAVVFGSGYVAYQRIGTTANADVVQYTRNLADGFVAVGFTKRQPGFVVLSALDQPLVDINTNLVSNRLAGTHTIVRIKTQKAQWQKRLRGPELVVIDKDGQIVTSPVGWSASDFAAIRKGIDCEHEGGSKRCGDPFADLHELFSRWDKRRVPEKARRFLEPFAEHR